jgi:hypothetical protein
MIISSDIHPQKKVYYIGALIIKELKQIDTKEFDFFNFRLRHFIKLFFYTIRINPDIILQ